MTTVGSSAERLFCGSGHPTTLAKDEKNIKDTIAAVRTTPLVGCPISGLHLAYISLGLAKKQEKKIEDAIATVS